MLQAFKNWINAEEVSTQVGASIEFEAPLHLKELESQEPDETPSHPPQHRGIPSKSLRRVMRSQLDLIKRIRSAMPFSNEDFDLYVLPVITEFVSFVHLLPGSERHHHSTPGGLVRHGLEAGLWAVMKTGEVIFATNGSPLERKTEEPKWILATFIGALMHDVGKPAVDVVVFVQEGDHWNPHDMHLTDWLRIKKADQYYLKWEEGRVGRHEKISAAMALKLLPDSTRVFLSDPNKEILHEMMSAISGKNIDSIMNRLVIEADQESVSSDLKKNPNVQDHYAAAVPVHAYVNEAISILINRKKWTANEGKCPLWVIDGTVYIWWAMFFEDIMDVIKERNIPGVPPNPDTVANILIERGLAVPNSFHESGSEVYYRYWKVIPNSEDKGIALDSEVLMLRVDDPDDIFAEGVPENGPATLVLPSEDESTQDSDPEQPKLNSENTESHDASIVKKKETDDQETSRPEVNEENTNKPELNGGVGGGLASLLAGVTANSSSKEKSPAEKKVKEGTKPESSKSPYSESDIDSFEGLAALAAQKQQKPVSDGGLLDMFGADNSEEPTKESSSKSEEETLIEEPKEGVKKKPKEKNVLKVNQKKKPEDIYSCLNRFGESGKLLSEEVKKIELGSSMLGAVLCRDGSKIYIHHPEGTRVLGDPGKIIKQLNLEGCLVSDPVMKSKVVQEVSGIKGLVLIDEISQSMLSFFTNLEENISTEPVRTSNETAFPNDDKPAVEALTEKELAKASEGPKPKQSSVKKSIKKKRTEKSEEAPKQKKKAAIHTDDLIGDRAESHKVKDELLIEDNQVTPKEAMQRFVSQVVAGKGSWLLDAKGIKTHSAGWEAHCYGRLVLEKISSDTGITIALLRKEISRRNKIKMGIKEGLIWISVESINKIKEKKGLS